MLELKPVREPMVERVAYFDNNATTMVDPRVTEAMVPFFTQFYGNASSPYVFGSQIHDRLENARIQVANLVGAANSQEIIFTACGSEGDNTVIKIATRALPDRKRIVTTNVEHMAILDTVREYEEAGYEVVRVPVLENGNVDMDAMGDAIDENTCLVSMMWANNESGVIFPVEEVAAVAKANGALFHTDAVQVAGKIPIDVSASGNIDMLSISAHKFHGPKGIGALYVRRDVPFSKFMMGGHQERNRRAGTEASALIIGMGLAAQLAQENLDEELTHVRDQRDRIEREILERIPGAVVNGAGQPRTPNTLSVSFEGADENVVLDVLDQAGICASSGSACNSEVVEPSYVMVAMNVPPERLNSVLRLSLSRFTTEAEVDRLLSVLPEAVEAARAANLLL